MADTKTLTRCSQVVGIKTDPVWDGFPLLCGRLAAGPHPDPEIGYREPLCEFCRPAVLAAIQEAVDG